MTQISPRRKSLFETYIKTYPVKLYVISCPMKHNLHLRFIYNFLYYTHVEQIEIIKERSGVV